MRTRELGSSPNLGLLYLKSAVTGLRGGDALPQDTLLLRDVAVDRDHVAAYARVCGYPLRDTLPPTYVHVLAFPLAVQLMTAPSFPFPLPGIVHVANRIEHVRPVTADEPLDLQVGMQDLRAHPRGRQFDVVAEARVADEPVWHGVSTYLRRGAPTEEASQAQLPVPDVEASVTWAVPGDIGRRYAAVSGDRNPIHLHPLAARVFGFPKPIAHGMWTKARCVAALDGRLPETFGVDVELRKPLLLPARPALAVEQRADGWSFALLDRKRSPHLVGRVRTEGETA